MNTSSPANSSISTTPVAGRCTTNAAMSLDDFRFPANLVSLQERKDEAMSALKSNIMAALNKEVKSLDDDNWMFEGPRSRINLMSRQGANCHAIPYQVLISSKRQKRKQDNGPA
ncbi:protein SAMBA isoform X1 [Cucurbita pepo subsp. pepo]|uniref:protein SAMBA isoform X1 n=1 Tax=Cucurbita pepo subsp. pepo TaxID=3664 RepID=UPI000C9D7EF2|nr:protein SAMBA isoform X1 [Cucurbita pepo subsp. pepo]